MATSDSITVTEDKSDVFSDETEDEKIESKRTFGFDVKTAKTDLTLLVEKKKIYVSRVALEIISPAFETLFSEQMLIGEELVVEIQGKTYEDFVEFLACIYPGKMHEVTSINVHKILPLAFEYDVNMLKKKCESVLIDEMSKADVGESFIVKCIKAADPFLLSVRQLGLDEIVKHRLKEIGTSDEYLQLDTKGKVYVYEKMLPSLRSEVCKYRYLSAGRNCKNSLNLEPFTDAKYKRLGFQLVVGEKKTTSYGVDIWSRKHKVDVEHINSITIMLTADSFKDMNHPPFPVACKVVVKNNDPHCFEGDFSVQQYKIINKNTYKYFNSVSMTLDLHSQDLQHLKYRMDGVYRISVHILMNNPKCS